MLTNKRFTNQPEKCAQIQTDFYVKFHYFSNKNCITEKSSIPPPTPTPQYKISQKSVLQFLSGHMSTDRSDKVNRHI